MHKMSPKIRLTLLSVIAAFLVVSFASPVPDLNVDSEASSNKHHRLRRNVLRDENKRWPNGVVPYEIDSNFSSYERQIILEAMNHTERNSCVKFREVENNEYHLKIRKSTISYCDSYVGYLKHHFGTSQQLNLGPGCVNIGKIVHELLHALGFHHQHSSPNRDDYIEIVKSNINSSYIGEFNKRETSEVTDFDLPYDYDSIMHYSNRADSKNNEDTIIANDPKYQDRMGNGIGMSPTDISKLNRMYGCYNCSELKKQLGLIVLQTLKV